MPDLPAAFWASTGILLLFHSGRRPTARWGSVWAAFSGVALAIAWLTKESAAHAISFCLIYPISVAYRDKSRAFMLFALVPLMVVLATECSICHAQTGDPLHRLYLAVVLNFGRSGLQGYRPLILAGRFMYMLILPAILITAALIIAPTWSAAGETAKVGRNRRFLGRAVAVGIVGIGPAGNRLLCSSRRLSHFD